MINAKDSNRSRIKRVPECHPATQSAESKRDEGA